ncbi:hypothetical protein THAOC_28416 [Thalassiosira oceanica]|uniref:Uncharacterized protein n=1 Tax=Thalassiosira oceanica TaxID=159749 RepID=K0RF37_THAOC|nr:hypothetical protein THAOC_28416 [Thalassiosira oceanica]|eukprot:EJK52323.1 hypothetical protein THAOC_28416 [Thalassiosira oceanica]
MAALARATGPGAVDDPAQAGLVIEQPRSGAEEAAHEAQVAERDLRDRKRGKGGKGKKDDDQKDGTKARKSKSGKVKSGKGDTGTNHCLEAFNEILSVGTYIYGKGGVCEDDFEVQLMCVSMYSGCSYYEKSLRSSSTFALDTCEPFDLPDVLAYDAETGMCTLTGIDLKRPEEDACQVPTAEYSTKITFHADDSSALYIDFSSNGGDSYYTEGEDDETRIATPYSDEGVRARRMQNSGRCNDCDNPSSDKKKEGESCGTRDLNSFIPSYDGTLAHTGCYENRVSDQNCLSGFKSADCCGDGCITYFGTDPSTYVCDRDTAGAWTAGVTASPAAPPAATRVFDAIMTDSAAAAKARENAAGAIIGRVAMAALKILPTVLTFRPEKEIQEDGRPGYIGTYYKCKDDCTPDGERCGYHGSIQDAGCWIDPNVCCSKKIQDDGFILTRPGWTNYKCGCGNRNDGDYCGSDCQEKGVESGRWFGGVFQLGKDIGRIKTAMCCGSGYAMKFGSGYYCNESGCLEAGKKCGQDGEFTKPLFTCVNYLSNNGASKTLVTARDWGPLARRPLAGHRVLEEQIAWEEQQRKFPMEWLLLGCE